MLAERGVLECLVEHLSIGTLFRLRRALGRVGVVVLEDMIAVCQTKLRYTDAYLSRVAPPADDAGGGRMSALGVHLCHTRTRCRECGTITRRAIRVCEECASTPGSYFELVSRRDIAHAFALQWQVRSLCKRIPVATRRCSGQYLYWMAHVRDVQERARRP